MKRRNEDLIKLSSSAVLMALSIILSRIAGLSFYIPIGGVNSVKVGLGSLPLVICLLINGPFYGMVSSAGADLIGALAFPTGGAYYPGFTIDAALLGLIPALVLKVLKNQRIKEGITGIGIIAISAAGLYITLPFLNKIKIGNFKMELTLMWRVLIPLLFIVCALVALAICYLLSKKEKREFTVLDLFVVYAIRDLIITPFLASLWINRLYGLDYGLSYLSQLLSGALEIPFNILLCYLLIYPLSIVTRNTIENTYDSSLIVYNKVYKGKKVN